MSNAALYDPSTGSVKDAGGSGGEIFEIEYAFSTKVENTAGEHYTGLNNLVI